MFTVKHISTGGLERIVSTESVTFDKVSGSLICGGNPLVAWDSGVAYVMNEQGKTVAVYNLSMKVEPVSISEEQVSRAREAAHKAAK